MFSQLSSFANKLSLDNLQDDDKETAASETQPATGAADEGGGVSSLLDGLSSAVSRSSRPPPAPKTAPVPDAVDVTNLAIISSLESKVAQLTDELGERAAALQKATREASSLREELKTERAGSRELATRYKALCESSSVDVKQVGVLTDRVKALQDQLAAESATCEDLKKQLSVISIPAAEETPKKVVKKVKKKKAAAVPASPMGEPDSVPASPAGSEPATPIKYPAPEQSASDELLGDMKRSMQQLKQRYEEEVEQLTAQARGLENAAQSAEDDYCARLSECSAQNATSAAAILSLEQTVSELKEQAKVETEQLMDKIQRLQQEAQEAEEAADLKYRAMMERNETLQDESSLLCQRLAKSESEGGSKDGEYSRLIADKDAKISDLSTKLSTLTEKAKDYVKKYSEAKMQIANFDEVKNKLTKELTEVTQSKDSEVVKMRLKLESQDSTCDSQKNTIHDLTEKLAETQRELQRCKESLQDGQNMVDVLQRDVKEAEGVAEGLRDQLVAADARATELAAEHEEELNHLRKNREEEIERLEVTIRDLKGNSQGFVNEMEELRKEKAVGDAALKSLDEYKKKAQAALKKSSETSAALNAEISRLKQVLESAQGENESLLASLEKERRNCEASEAVVSELRDEIKRMLEVEQKYEASLSAALQAAETSKAQSERDATPEPMVTVGADQEHNFDGASDDQREQTESYTEDDELPSQFAGPVASGETDKVELKDAPSPGQQRNDIKGSEAEEAHPKAVAPMSRSISGSALQATLAAKNGSSMEISEGLHLPLQVPDKLLYIGEITQQLEKMRGELVSRNMEIDALNKDVESERTEKALLKDKLEDCLAFLERSKKLQNGDESAVNMEYLKNCILHYMLSDSVNDRLRLYPVIATILKFTTAEKTRLQNCPLHVDEIAASIEIADKTWQNLSGTFSGLWGSYSSSSSNSASSAPDSSSS